MGVSKKYKKRRYLKGGKKSRKYKKSRKRRKQKRKRKRKTRKRRRMRGGGCGCAAPMTGGGPAPYKCNYPSNIGKTFTGYKLNTNPVLPDPKSLNQNFKAHGITQKGGFFMNDFGLGDVLLNWYKGTNAATNMKHRFRGAANEPKADPMYQPELLKPVHFDKTTANLPAEYNSASTIVAGKTI
jgi:hypothetical protein